MTPTVAELTIALAALDRARGQIAAVLRASDPAPEACARAWRRAAGELRTLQLPERRDRVSEEGRYGHE